MGKPAKVYSEDVAVEIEASLDHLARNPKGLKVKEMVFRLRPKIEAAMASGHTLEDIVEVFREKKVEITFNTLKQYLQESRSQGSNSDPNSDPPATTDLDAKVAKQKKRNADNVPPPPPSPEPESELPQSDRQSPDNEAEVQTAENADDPAATQPKKKYGSHYSEGKNVSDEFNL